MASLASGRYAHHRLIAKSSRRRLQHFAAAVVTSVSSQLSSNCSLVGLGEQQQQCLQGKKKNGAAEEIRSPCAGPFSSSADDSLECLNERAPYLDYYCNFYSDGATGSSERRPPLGPPIPLWMSATIMDERRNPPPRNSPPNEFRFSSSFGSLREVGVRQEPEIELSHTRFHVNEFSRGQSPTEWQSSYRQHGRGGDGDKSGRRSPFALSQFRGSSLLTSSWGSRQCMQSSREFVLQLEHKFETYHGRRHMEELSRVQIWHNPRRFHMGHAHNHHGGGDHDKSGEASKRILGWGLWGDIGLAIGKGGAGYVSGSTALIADAAHSVSDIALSGVALWTSKVAHSPKDKQHPYGHGKFESVGALGISVMLVLTGGGIAWHALESLQRTRRIGEEEHSELLKASAWHHRSDAISSVVALLGIGGAILGMPLLDPVAGFVVSGMIMKAGFETGYQSLQDLVDSGVPESVLSPIRKTVLQVEGVEGCHHLRGRKMGSFIHLDVHIEVDPWLSVSAAHNIAAAVRHQVQTKHPEVTETFVHIEPADGSAKTLTHREAEIARELHVHGGDYHKHPDKNEYSFNKKDLTNLGSKSDLMKSNHKEACVDDGLEIDMRQHSGIEQDVRNVVGANFHEKMSINQVTSHFVGGKVVVEVEVSMNPEISVRNAMDYADEAQRAILEVVSDISMVRVQLKLSKSST